MKRCVSPCGFTLLELLATIGAALIIGVLLIAILGPALAPRPHGVRQLKDQTQVRGILQGMVVWAQNHKDVYPLPSLIDTANTTVAEEGQAKDTTANIMSLLVFNGFVPVEMFVSPAESNGAISVMNGYQTDRPAAAVSPEKALWDPAFSADYTSPKGGNNSYGHLLPAENRLRRWTNTFTSTEAVIGNRGPEIASVTYERDGTPIPVLANKDSNTLLIHGSRTKWEGQVGFNDNHVDYSLHTWIEGIDRVGADGKKRGDVLFYDEPDDASPGTNMFLGMFLKAGPTAQDFKMIWD